RSVHDDGICSHCRPGGRGCVRPRLWTQSTHSGRGWVVWPAPSRLDFRPDGKLHRLLCGSRRLHPAQRPHSHTNGRHSVTVDRAQGLLVEHTRFESCPDLRDVLSAITENLPFTPIAMLKIV
ncbi:hypothetical protein EGW08_004939, partial [Elysia chlorotica]